MQESHLNNRISVLTKGASAEVQISIRTTSVSGPSSAARPIPLEPFSFNKDMGRVLIRRGGETIGAGEHQILRIRQALISLIIRYCPQACRLIHPVIDFQPGHEALEVMEDAVYY